MGYTTEFDGSVSINPPLNPAEIAYLNKFADVRHMKRTKGPYFVDGSGDFFSKRDDDIIDHNRPDESQPGLWCQWIVNESGTEIEWDGGEKFYSSDEWMEYIIDHFLKPNAIASKSGDSQFKDFTFDHVVNGEIRAYGEENDDRWTLVVDNNNVTTRQAQIVW